MNSERRTESADVEPLLSPQLQIEKADDVLDLLSRQVRAVERSQAADSLMKARAVAQIAPSLLRAIEAREAAALRCIEGRLANLDHEAQEACADLIAQSIRAVVDALPLSPAQRRDAPDIVRAALRRFGASRRAVGPL